MLFIDSNILHVSGVTHSSSGAQELCMQRVTPEIQSDSLARGPTEVYPQIFNEFVNKLTNDELTTGYYQQDGATCHTSNASMREVENFFKLRIISKNFGHPDLPI